MKGQKGQILILALVVLGLVVANSLTIIASSLAYFTNSRYNVTSDSAYLLAEAGIDKALASLNAAGGSYLGDNETSLGNGSFSVNITSPDSNTKIIESTGYFPSKAQPKSTKTIRMTAAKGVGASFNYAVQIGEGGLVMSNGSIIKGKDNAPGSVYSNGNITMSNNASITGDAYVAGGVSPEPDQVAECQGINCTDFIFGKSVGGNSQLDVSQSFKPTVTTHLSKVSLRLKKVGSPPDLTVRILGDNGGKPNKNNVLASTILQASLVTTEYGLVNLSFTTSPQLTQGTTYWIVLDTGSNNSNYWKWKTDSSGGYLNGQAAWSPNWQASTPVWNLLSSDFDFQTFMGGYSTFIQGTNEAVIGGDAHANTIRNITVTGGAYYQTAENVTAGSMHPDSPNPANRVMPISEGNVTGWKNEAAQTIIPSIGGCPSNLGPGKYTGNVSFSNNCTITITSPLWITGSMVLSNGVTFNLNPLFGTSSGVIIIGGQTTFQNNIKIRGTGQTGSFLMLISDYDSRTNEQTAISVSNTGNEGILYAPTGIIDIANNNQLKEVTAWKVIMGNGVVVEYESGLASTFFSSGPTGAYSLIKGSYYLK